MMGVERTSYRETARTNGWTLPPHPLQVVAYVVIIYFMVIYFTTLVPHLPTEWQPPGYIINGLATLAHIVVLLTATSINPADPNVLRKRFNGKLPTLDRTKHKHVIVDQHCYICDVDVSSRSKHCSSCNKCVSEFDHHCKWLNNCVGERNYRWFLATLATGIVAALMVVCVCFTEFIGYFTDRDDGLVLQPYRDLLSQGENGTEAVFRILHQPVPHQGWLALVGITSLLALIAVALLIHLLCFHIYLIHRGITTYDYIVNQRTTESDSERNVNQNKPDVKPKKGNRITPSHPSDTQKKMLRNKSPLRRSMSAEKRMEEGEVPPPFAGPIHREGDFVHHKQKGGGDLETSPVKKLKKKKKSKDFSDGPKKQVISSVDNPQMYHSPKSSKRLRQQELADSENLPSYRSESGESLTDLTPYTVSTSAGSRQKGAKARPLPQRKPGGLQTQTQPGDAKPGTRGGAQEPEFYVHYSSQASLLSGSASSMGSQKKKRKKSKAKAPLEEGLEEDEDLGSQGDLNTTTMFEVNPSAQFNQDGTLNYSNGFGSLPLTPIPKRTLPPKAEVPPLDLSGLRTSQESTLSYQPYSATQRSTDTFRASERFPQVNGRLKAVPEGGMDTEV